MKTILILEDRFEIRHQLINQGDRAIADGTHQLFTDHHFKTQSGGFKNFPYFNISRFKGLNSTQEIETVFKEQFTLAFSKTGDSGFRNRFMRSRLINNRLVKWVEDRFRKKYSRGIIETFEPYLFRKYHANHFFQNIQNADLVIFNGSGLLSDHLKYYLPCYLFEIYAAKQMGQKVVPVNLTVSVENTLLKKMVAFVLKDLDYFMVREPISQKYLLNLLIEPAKIKIVPDFSFVALEPIPVHKISLSENDTIKIGLTIRGDREVNYPFWTRLLEILAEYNHIDLYFFHTCKSHDQKVFNQLSRSCPFDLKEVDPPGDYHDLIDPLSKMHLVMTDRYHAMIFSLFAHVPFIGFDGTTFKNRGLAELMDYPLQIFDISEDNFPEIKKTLDYVFGNHSTLREQMSTIPERIRRQLNEDIQILKEL